MTTMTYRMFEDKQARVREVLNGYLQKITESRGRGEPFEKRAHLIERYEIGKKYLI